MRNCSIGGDIPVAFCFTSKGRGKSDPVLFGLPENSGSFCTIPMVTARGKCACNQRLPKRSLRLWQSNSHWHPPPIGVPLEPIVRKQKVSYGLSKFFGNRSILRKRGLPSVRRIAPGPRADGTRSWDHGRPLRKTAPSGGRFRATEYGRPCMGTNSAYTPPRLPTLLPP